ncbi:MAG: hypothetical protein NQ127_03530 [Candidatus Cardinium sp.]|nr:hypothetical protein [Candidatus Cardinium sp.]
MLRGAHLFYRLLLDPFAHAIVCTIIAYLLAPTQFVKVIYQETGQSYGSIIRQYLRSRKFRCFYAGAHMYALRQFVSSFTFGFALWLFQLSVTYYPITHLGLSIGWACCLVGMLETIVTIASEMREITANKGPLMKRKAAYRDIAVPLLLRNILFNIAAIAPYEFTKEQDNPFMNMIFGIVFGIVVSVLTMPFDLVITQNCGSETRMTWISRLKQNILIEKKLGVIFNGLTMRMLQVVPYSIAHSMVMLCLERFTV